MKFVHLFQFALRWLLVLFEAGALLWLALLLLAVLGWAMWGVLYLYRRGLQTVGQPRPAISSRLPSAPSRSSQRPRGQAEPRRSARR